MSLRAALQGKGMLALLEARKAGLRAMIAEQFRQAREAGRDKPDVSQLSATLREVKRQIAIAKGGQRGLVSSAIGGALATPGEGEDGKPSNSRACARVEHRTDRPRRGEKSGPAEHGLTK